MTVHAVHDQFIYNALLYQKVAVPRQELGLTNLQNDTRNPRSSETGPEPSCKLVLPT